MLRKLGASITAYSFILATSLPVMAADWPSMYQPQDSLMAGVVDDNEMVGMAYFRLPFGGPPHARNNEASFGFTLAKPMPRQFQSYGYRGSERMMSLLDLQLSPYGVEDLRVSGLSATETYRRFNARSEGEPSAIWTYGLMAAALGVVAAVVLLGNGDGFKSNDDVPPEDNTGNTGDTGDTGDTGNTAN